MWCNHYHINSQKYLEYTSNAIIGYKQTMSCQGMKPQKYRQSRTTIFFKNHIV